MAQLLVFAEPEGLTVLRQDSRGQPSDVRQVGPYQNILGDPWRTNGGDSTLDQSRVGR